MPTYTTQTRHSGQQQPPLPPLSKPDKKRLHLYLTDLNEDPRALARACSCEYLDVLHWLDSPLIRRYLAVHDELRRRADDAARRQADTAAAPLRAACIDALKEALDRSLADTRSQSSLRLAASALLRALAKPPTPLPPSSSSAAAAAPTTTTAAPAANTTATTPTPAPAPNPTPTSPSNPSSTPPTNHAPAPDPTSSPADPSPTHPHPSHHPLTLPTAHPRTTSPPLRNSA